ncbi:hypothetical protein LINPERPRIM_LOCUS38202 [Linum perenne]
MRLIITSNRVSSRVQRKGLTARRQKY